MKDLTHTCHYALYDYDELADRDRDLIEAAKHATKGSYAPYSKFHVGAALRLADGTIVTGANQENVAFPSGLCAERTVLFYAGAVYLDRAVTALAIGDILRSHNFNVTQYIAVFHLCCDLAHQPTAERSVTLELWLKQVSGAIKNGPPVSSKAILQAWQSHIELSN